MQPITARYDDELWVNAADKWGESGEGVQMGRKGVMGEWNAVVLAAERDFLHILERYETVFERIVAILHTPDVSVSVSVSPGTALTSMSGNDFLFARRGSPRRAPRYLWTMSSAGTNIY